MSERLKVIPEAIVDRPRPMPRAYREFMERVGPDGGYAHTHCAHHRRLVENGSPIPVLLPRQTQDVSRVDEVRID